MIDIAEGNFLNTEIIVTLLSYLLYYTLLEESSTIVVFAFKDNRSEEKKLTFL